MLHNEALENKPKAPASARAARPRRSYFLTFTIAIVSLCVGEWLVVPLLVPQGFCMGPSIRCGIFWTIVLSRIFMGAVVVSSVVWGCFFLKWRALAPRWLTILLALNVVLAVGLGFQVEISNWFLDAHGVLLRHYWFLQALRTIGALYMAVSLIFLPGLALYLGFSLPRTGDAPV